MIYKIQNKEDGRIYIGKTERTLEERMKEHCRNRKPSYIDRSIRKHGIDNFDVSVVEECSTVEELNEREKFWIKYLNCKYPHGYNKTDGGDGSKGYVAPPELRERYSRERKGRPVSPEARAKISAKAKGRVFTDEHKANISAAKLGHVVLPETREKLRQQNLGKKLTPEQCLQRSITNKKNRPVRCVETNEIFRSISEAKRQTGITNLSHALKDPKYTAGGYHWEYVD